MRFDTFLRQRSAVMGKPEAAIEWRDHLHHRTRKLVSAGGNAQAVEFCVEPREGIEVVCAQGGFHSGGDLAKLPAFGFARPCGRRLHHQRLDRAPRLDQHHLFLGPDRRDDAAAAWLPGPGCGQFRAGMKALPPTPARREAIAAYRSFLRAGYRPDRSDFRLPPAQARALWISWRLWTRRLAPGGRIT